MNRSSLCLFWRLLPWLLLLCCNFSGFTRAENLEKIILNEIMGKSYVYLPEEFTRNCSQTYGSNAAETFKVEISKFIHCSTKVLLENNIRLNIADLFGEPNSEKQSSAFNFNVLFNKVLPALKKQCIPPLIAALKGCTNLDGHRNIAILESLYDFFTENGGRRFYDLVNDKSQSECMYQYENNSLQCFDRLRTQLQLQGNASIFNKENCRSLDEQSDCAIRTIKQHCSEATAKLLTEMKNLIFKGTACSANVVNSGGRSNKSHIQTGTFLISIIMSLRVFSCVVMYPEFPL